MAWVDWIVGVGIILLVIGFSYSFVMKRVSSQIDVVKIFDMKSIGLSYFQKLFASLGSPENWNATSFEKIGLMSYLYRIPIFLEEKANIEKINERITVSLILDEECELKAWNSTLRLIREDEEIPFSLNNTSFCATNFIKETDLIFPANVSANSSIFYFLYFSPDKEVKSTSYAEVSYLDYATPLNKTVLPQEKLKALSISKLRELKKIDYEEALRSLGGYDFNVEVRE